jgi:ATP-dependent DNA ligase
MRGTKEELLRAAQEFGLEGMVVKRPDSVYESGRRSGAWVKFKITKAQEFVIGGYTLPEGGRKYFGSLLVGYNSPEGSRVRRQSRHRFFRQGFGESLHQVPETQKTRLPVCKSAREIKRKMGPRDHAGHNATLPLA